MKHNEELVADLWSVYLGIEVTPLMVKTLRRINMIVTDAAIDDPIDYELSEEGTPGVVPFSPEVLDTIFPKLYTTPQTYTSTSTPTSGYTAGGIVWNPSKPVEQLEEVQLDLETFSQVMNAEVREAEKRRKHYEKVYSAYEYNGLNLPDPRSVVKFRIWKKDGEITHNPRWFIGVQWRFDENTQKYDEFYLHDYDAMDFS